MIKSDRLEWRMLSMLIRLATDSFPSFVNDTIVNCTSELIYRNITPSPWRKCGRSVDEVWSWIQQRMTLFIPEDKQLNLNAVNRVIGARAIQTTFHVHLFATLFSHLNWKLIYSIEFIQTHRPFDHPTIRPTRHILERGLPNLTNTDNTPSLPTLSKDHHCVANTIKLNGSKIVAQATGKLG